MPATTPRIVLLDGEAIGDDRKLHDGETITFVSPVGGG
jgi:sulfur carrier protein ThiS